MHFSIPDTEEVREGNTSFTSYNIYVNGVFHCRTRYKQLRQFHDELKKQYGQYSLPDFPKKRLLALSSEEVEQRRIMLERYIQLVSQDHRIKSGDIFNAFLLSAQQDSQKEQAEEETLDVFLMNGHKITVSLMSTDQTEDVLEAVAQQIEIPDDYVYYFGLFLVKKEDDGDTSIVRKFQDFESPCLSLKAANKTAIHRIVLRKSYWDSQYDDDLLQDKVTMNLLYVQANSDIERQWVQATKEQLGHLAALRKKNSKREFLRVARTLKHYGYIQFQPCVTDYLQPNARCLIAAGGTELNFRIQLGEIIKDGSFKITRMRCWRMTTIYPNSNGSPPPSSSNDVPDRQLEFSFEYLMSQNNLQWVSVISEQAMLMSMCLQGMVDELVMKKKGQKFKRPQDRLKVGRNRGPFKSLSRELSQGLEGDDQSAINKAMGSMKKFGKGLQEKPEETVTENDAFEGIGDDDL